MLVFIATDMDTDVLWWDSTIALDYLFFHCFRELLCMNIQCDYHFLLEGPHIFGVSIHSATMYLFGHVPKCTWVRISLGYITKNGMGMAGSQGVKIISFNKNANFFFQSDCINIHSHQQYVKNSCPTQQYLPAFYRFSTSVLDMNYPLIEI